MKIKIIESKKIDEFEKQINEFNDANDVKFTQTHVTKREYEEKGNYLVYTAVLFYEKKEEMRL